MSNTSRPKKGGKRHNTLALEELVRFVNSVPHDVELPDPKTNWEQVKTLLKSKDFEKYRKLTGPIRRRRFLRRLLGPDAPLTSNRIFGSYENLRLGRQWLQRIAEIAEAMRLEPVLQSGRMKWRIPPLLQPHVSVVTDECGFLRFTFLPMVAALKDIRVMAVRNCPICRKFFVARRKDQPCCTPKCANALRTRRWREEYPHSYKLKRVSNAEREVPASPR
jgi:hypothetical protein